MRHSISTAAVVAATLLAGSASAAIRTFNATLKGSNEVPANASTATGQCTATLDDVTGSVTVTGTFTGLDQPATLAHRLFPPRSRPDERFVVFRDESVRIRRRGHPEDVRTTTGASVPY